MSTPLPTPADLAAPTRIETGWPNWVREPLLHFVFLGGLLFAVDHFLITRSDDPHTIVVSAEVDAEAKQIFKSARGREPTAEELSALRRIWLDNEVLYREGLALQVDKGDTAIRDRVIFKALSVVDANVKLPTYDDALLRKWFEAHRDKYDEPARFDFQEALPTGENTEAAVRALVAELNAAKGGEVKAGLRVFKGRPHSNLVLSYGEEFAKTLEALPEGEWRAEQAKDGWRAIRLESKTTPKPAEYEPLRAVVLQDWTDTVMAEQRSAAVKELSKKYTLKFEADQK